MKIYNNVERNKLKLYILILIRKYYFEMYENTIVSMFHLKYKKKKNEIATIYIIIM